eukprot:1137395-Pelagomonas_calceolata.AAC.3
MHAGQDSLNLSTKVQEKQNPMAGYTIVQPAPPCVSWAGVAEPQQEVRHKQNPIWVGWAERMLLQPAFNPHHFCTRPHKEHTQPH